MTPTRLRGLAAGLIAANLGLVVFSLLGSAVLHRGLPAPPMDYARLASITAQASIALGFAAALLIMLAGQGTRGTVALLGLSAVIGGGSEWLCIATGFPYGHYSYTRMLGPTLAGLPLLILDAWFMAVSTAVHLAHRMVHGILPITLLTATVVTLWDLVLDPALTTGFPAWEWHETGPFYGIPTTNFLSWFAVSALIAGLFTALRRHWRPDGSLLPLWLYVAQGLLPAGLALLYGRVAATAIWILGTGLMCTLLYLRRSADRGNSA